MPDGRFIYVSKKQRDFIVAVLDALPEPARAYYLPLMECQDAWDVAPEDPVEAADEAITEYERQGTLTSVDSYDGALLVCRALGLPSSDETTG